MKNQFNNFQLNCYKPKSSKGYGCLILFGLPFMLAGLFVINQLFYSPYKKTQESASWHEVPCTIISSSLKTNHDSDGDTYAPEISYTYTFNGENFTSNKIDFSGSFSSSEYNEENSIVLKNPAGSKTICYVNPQNPAEAVLLKDWGRGAFKWIILPFGGVFFCVGLGIMIFGASPWLFKGSNRNSGNLQEVILKPTGQRVASVCGLLFINVFWNGIVSVFAIFWLFNFSKSGNKGFWETWGLGLFLLPFLVIGLFMFWGLIKAFKKIFAPSITISLKQGIQWLIGEEVELHWQLPFNNKPQSIIFTLNCTESATYSRGTSTSTDKKLVQVIPLEEFRPTNFNGSSTFTIPQNIMPSFHSSNNAITWELCVKTVFLGNETSDSYVIYLCENDK